MAQHGSTEITWLGHSTFKVTTPGQRRILLDCWVSSNPSTPAPLKKIEQLDAMLITHGHFDHLGDAVEIGKATGATAVGIFEITNWLERKGIKNTAPMNTGGTQSLLGLNITMVQAFHSSGIAEDNGTLVYGGEAAGYIVELENGLRLYHSGDTALFGDMRLIGELYRPDLAFLPIGSLFTMGPREAAYAIRLLGVPRVIPMHWGTFPALTGRPEQLQQLTADIPGLEIHVLQPGETLTL